MSSLFFTHTVDVFLDKTWQHIIVSFTNKLLVPFQGNSVQMKQLQQQNEKLREAVVKYVLCFSLFKRQAQSSLL